jgi:hypothetical protein
MAAVPKAPTAISPTPSCAPRVVIGRHDATRTRKQLISGTKKRREERTKAADLSE